MKCVRWLCSSKEPNVECVQKREREVSWGLKARVGYRYKLAVAQGPFVDLTKQPCFLLELAGT